MTKTQMRVSGPVTLPLKAHGVRGPLTPHSNMLGFRA